MREFQDSLAQNLGFGCSNNFKDRQMIKSTFEAIQKLANSQVGLQEFGESFIQMIAELTAVDFGAIWLGNNSPFTLLAQHARSGPARLNLSREAHDKLLADASQQSKPLIVRPAKDGVATEGTTIWIGKFDRIESQVIELILHRQSTEQETQEISQVFASALKMVNQASPPENWSQHSAPPAQPENTPTPVVSSPQQNLSQDAINNYLTAIHSSIDKKLACANVANESRRVLECDRVSVLLKDRGKFRLFAISGQPSINRRSNTSKLLEKLGQRLLKTGQPFWYPEETEMPSQISSILDDYLALTTTRSFIVEPIMEKLVERIEDPESHERKGNAVIGGIVYEHCSEQWSKAEVASRIEFTTQHGGNALRNAATHHRLFLFPIWNLLGKSRILTSPRMIPKTLMAVAAVILATLILMFWQVDFYVTATGVLVPKELRPVFVKVDGDVSRLDVEHGQLVKQGEVLCLLTSREQELRINQVETDLRNVQERLLAIQDRRFENRDGPDSIEDNINSLKAQIKSLEEQRTILASIAKDMEVTSPIDGQVISWDLQRRLQGRPVQRGQQVMEIADTAGEWELELHLQDRRIGHVLEAMKRNETGRLPITFLLAADTSVRFSGELIEIADATEVTSDNKQSVVLRASIDADNIEIAQARTGITAKIICGRTSLGHLWLHDVKEFLQKNVMFFFS